MYELHTCVYTIMSTAWARLVFTQSWEMYNIQTCAYTIMRTVRVTDLIMRMASYRLMFYNAIWKTIINVQVRSNPPFPGKNEHDLWWPGFK